MTLSRREFLQSLGLTAAGARLFGVALPDTAPAASSPAPHFAPPQVLQGRVLRSGRVENLRTSQTVRSLLPDEVISIHAENALFYGTDGGSVLRQHIQPIQPYNPDTRPTNNPPGTLTCVEVAAPATTLHTYAAPDAPLETRLGHGAVMRVTDTINNRYGRWYNISDANDTNRGWTQASHWRMLPESTGVSSARNPHLHLDRTANQLTAYTGNRPIFSTLVRLPKRLIAGDFTLTPAGHVSLPQSINGQPQDAPYRFQLRSNGVTGDTYSAHAFTGIMTFICPLSKPATPPRLEFNILAAKWLYTWTPDNIPVTVT